MKLVAEAIVQMMDDAGVPNDERAMIAGGLVYASFLAMPESERKMHYDVHLRLLLERMERMGGRIEQ